eukprot:1143835-Pelagomonas_calceolata.AAC.3
MSVCTCWSATRIPANSALLTEERLPLPEGKCVNSCGCQGGVIGISFSRCLMQSAGGYAVQWVREGHKKKIAWSRPVDMHTTCVQDDPDP